MTTNGFHPSSNTTLNGHPLNAVYNALQQEQDHHQSYQQPKLAPNQFPRDGGTPSILPPAIMFSPLAPFTQMNSDGQQTTTMPFNVPLLPPEVYKDFITLSNPVTEADEPLLIQTLSAGRRERKSHREILTSLHGVTKKVLQLTDCPSLIIFVRKTAILLPYGRIITSNIMTVSRKSCQYTVETIFLSSSPPR
jgi:hypothetical protein